MKTKIPDAVLAAEVSRRGLVKTTALGGLAMASSAFTLPFTRIANAAEAISPAKTGEKVVWSACTVNCGSRCPLRMHVVDGEIKYVETDNTGNDDYDGLHQVRACLRGRSSRWRVYSPDRIKYPMKRVGKRGEGKFERISWDEAYDIIATNMQRLIKEYGNESIYLNYGTGTLGGTLTRSWPPGKTLVARLMNCCGGYLNHYGDYSSAQIAAGLNYTYGGWADGNSPSDIENSKLVVLFGNNPGETRMSGGGITWFLEQARERSNARMIVIDPRYTDTAAGREDEWIPIRPGTDAALVAGIAWVLINENLVDQPFLDNYCIGYDEKTLPADAPPNGHYKAYILGQGEDGIAKTPQWASHITGIPADRIIKLAREIGSVKPAYICQGWGPQRQANGEQTARAIAMLPILTGNVGIHGGNSGARESTYTITIERLPVLENPVKTAISCFSWTDAIARGPEMTALRDGVRGKDKLDVPIKFLWNYAGNTLINQHSDINKTHEILQDEAKCEMIVVIDNFMTSSAKYADILLPDLMTVEQEDIIPNDYAGNMGYLIFIQPATTPKFERKPIYWVLSEIARRLGDDVYQRFTEGRTQAQWLQYLYAKMQARDPALPAYDELKKMGIYKRKDPNGHFVAYKKFHEDPQANPLKTPSGKIEIYSERLATLANTWELKKDEIIHPLPAYTPGFDGWDDPLRQRYPLQLTGFHYKARTHSSYGNIDVLQQACPQEIWINPIDAQARGIQHGDTVRVFNQNGQMLIPAKVTPRILPGVTAIGQGAWLNADMFGDQIDRGGSINILTSHRPSPLAKGNPSHSNLVQVEKA
ncbi:dimethyl sulfoxide reductase subunit A [Salmonella enterica subsp. enterica]|nr:DMSO/selenate family reductase complex A subunit [Salmonella enterica]EAA6895806.1 dimethyl sulfoxide reductase subunit A [Salmonella enterica subsp. enterica serovar Paratyphi A]EDE1608700.1 molybdopterin-dependent oxidoreductase [Salmonella enterica subsp. enterica serovar Typhi]EBA6481921.1 dimethyl sulfoxide reductase subunit A [Salmonella enterica]EBC6503570.1 dimethyl sulfoxide reductase subunit A [Salmonella enterica]EBG3088594.1 dimethyl sulfoxide reductase subunit A [Salmonella ent